MLTDMRRLRRSTISFLRVLNHRYVAATPTPINMAMNNNDKSATAVALIRVDGMGAVCTAHLVIYNRIRMTMTRFEDQSCCVYSSCNVVALGNSFFRCNCIFTFVSLTSNLPIHVCVFKKAFTFHSNNEQQIFTFER